MQKSRTVRKGPYVVNSVEIQDPDGAPKGLGLEDYLRTGIPGYQSPLMFQSQHRDAVIRMREDHPG